MGGNDGLRTDSIGAYRRDPYYFDGTGEYLRGITNFWNSSLSMEPRNIWPARNALQNFNAYTYMAGAPYTNCFRFTPYALRYSVTDPFEWSEDIVYSARYGYNPNSPTAEKTAAKIDCMIGAAGLEAKAGQTSNDLAGHLKLLNQWKETPCLKDEANAELKAEVEELIQKAEKYLKSIQEVMENKPNANGHRLSQAEVKAKVDAIRKAADVDFEEITKFFERLKEVEQVYNDAQAEAAADEATAELEGAGGGASGETTVTTADGDKELDTAGLAKEYGVPVPRAEADVATVVANVKANTANNDDAKDYTNFMNMFTTKEINSSNIADVLYQLLAVENYDLSDGIYEMDNSRTAMQTLVTALKACVTSFKNSEYITADEAKTLNAKLDTIISSLGTDDDFKKSDRATFNATLKEVVATLNAKGTQESFDAAVKEKQQERTTKAVADFYKAHANGKEVEGTPALPAGVTYLPNSKMFQWKYDESTTFKGKNYKELTDKILASKKTEVIAKWHEIQKAMDGHLKGGSAAAATDPKDPPAAPAAPSELYTNVTTKGKKIEKPVLNSADEELGGVFYSYEGKIYKVKSNDAVLMEGCKVKETT